MFDPCKGALPAIRKGLPEPLAVAASTRLSGLRMCRRSVKLASRTTSCGSGPVFLRLRGTPKEIVGKLNRAVQALLRTPEVRKEIADEGGEAGGMTPEEFTGFLQAERKRWQGLVVKACVEGAVG